MKDNHFPTQEQFRSALAPLDPEFARRTEEMLLSLAEKPEERPMKKKIPFAVALAIVLVIVSCFTALALTVWRDDLGTLFQMFYPAQGSREYMEDWTLDEKLMMLDVMERNETPMDAALLRQARDDSLSVETRGQAADRIISHRYGINGRIDTITPLGIMETEMGKEFYDWSIEDMAWYSQMEWQHQVHGQDKVIHVTPREGEIAQAEALAIAREALEKQGMSAAILEGSKLRVLYAYYPCYSAPLGEPFWSFIWLKNEYEETAAVYLTWRGSVMKISLGEHAAPEEDYYEAIAARRAEMTEKMGKQSLWRMEDWCAVDPDAYRMPTEKDIAPEEAIRIAREALKQNEGMTEADLDDRTVYTVLRKYVDYGGVVKYEYIVRFVPRDDPRDRIDSYACLAPETGEVRLTHHYDLPPLPTPQPTPPLAPRPTGGINGFDALEEIRAAKGEPENWTLEERAYFLPGHGLPKEHHIAQSQAEAIGWKTLLAEDPLHPEAYWNHVYAFFISGDPGAEQPDVWQMNFCHDDRAGDAQVIVTIAIDAESGEVFSADFGESNG